MNKVQFLKCLNRQLHGLKRTERKKYINDYEEMISDMVENGMTEQEAIMKLGDIRKICSEILENSESRYCWIDWKGMVLIAASALLLLLSICRILLSNVSSIIIGGADGPTSVFLAGKIPQVSRLYIITGIALLVTGIYLIIRKLKRM